MNIILFTEAETQQTFPVTDPRILHLINIIGCKTGDEFDAGIIDGPRGKGKLISMNDKSAEIDFHWESTIPELYPITLLVGHPRPRAVRKILKDATTLGVSAIHFIGTDKGEKSYLSSKIWKDNSYYQYLLEGAQQAFCTRIPEVKIWKTLKEYLADIGESQNRIALDNYESVKPLSECGFSQPYTILAIGSERGWSARERDLLRQADFMMANMGERVLTTDTAVIVAAALAINNPEFNKIPQTD